MSHLCFRKPVLVRSSPLLSNGFSSSLPQTPPSVIMYVDPSEADLGKLVIRRAGEITPIEKKVPLKEMETTIGSSSNGWLATLKDGKVSLQHIDDQNQKHISLPPIVTKPYCQTKIITNVAISSSSLEEVDCVVAVKFLGLQVSFFRPALSNNAWINMKISNPCFFSSPIMFSKKDEMFHLLGSGGHLIESWDLQTLIHIPKFKELQLLNTPNLTKADKELLDSCYKSEYLVESRTTGEIFMVKQYKKTVEIMDGIGKMKTEAVMVFKIDEDGNAFYTQDIGDLCVFITKYETFCVPSSSFPDVLPNHVKILDVDETAIINLADRRWTC